MRWIRPLFLALAAFALAPGLCQAQVGIWAPLSLPVLFGQEAPPRPVENAPSPEEEFGIETGPPATPSLPPPSTPSPAPTPTQTRECQDLKELVEATWSIFGRRNAAPATNFAVFQTSVAQCGEGNACCPMTATVVRECLTSCPCPVAFRPY